MSRIGKEPVKIPSGVDVKIDGLLVTARGKLGEESFRLTDDVIVSQQDGAADRVAGERRQSGAHHVGHDAQPTAEHRHRRVQRFYLQSGYPGRRAIAPPYRARPSICSSATATISTIRSRTASVFRSSAM